MRQPRRYSVVFFWCEWPGNLSLGIRLLLNVVMLDSARTQQPAEDDIARIRASRNHRLFTQPQDGSIPLVRLGGVSLASFHSGKLIG